MSSPLVSVIIPHFNRADLVKRAVQSVLDQTYQNFEILIVDDASTDGSPSQIHAYLQDIPQARLILHEQNHGANYCRHQGVLAAKGDLLAFLDSDDYFYPDKLQKQVKLLGEMSDISFVVSYYSDSLINKPKPGRLDLKDLLYQNNIGGFSSLVVRKKDYLAVGGLDLTLPSAQDWDFYLKLLSQRSGYVLPEILFYYDQQPDSISKNPQRVISGYDRVSQKARDLNQDKQLVDSQDLLAYHTYYKAMRYYSLGLVLETRRFLKESLAIKKSKPALAYLPLTYLGYPMMSKILQLKRIFVKTLSKR